VKRTGGQQATEVAGGSRWFVQRSPVSLVTLACALWGSPALAQTQAAELEPAPQEIAELEILDPEPLLEIHGFVSQGFIKSTEHNYLVPSERGSFEFTEVGINFTKQLTDDLRVGMQLFAHDLGTLGNYQPQFDWYYLDYRLWDWLGIRVGRTKMPFGLFNEVNDIDAARVPILLPGAVYTAIDREALLAQTGVELYGRVSLDLAGALEYRAYTGTLFLASENTGAAFTNLHVPYMFGGRAVWFTPLDGLEIGGSVQRYRYQMDFLLTPEQRGRLEAAMLLPAGSTEPVRLRQAEWRWIASLQYQLQDLFVAAEYTRVTADTETDPFIGSPRTKSIATGWYALASYGVTDWLTPGAYYSLRDLDFDGLTGPTSYQHDLAATLRFDLNAHWLVKLEGHYMHGLGALDPATNDAADRPALNGRQQDWGLFLIKTTAYF
jgi:hypothetical protein